MCIDAVTRAANYFGYNCSLAHDACATRDLAFKGVTVSAGQVHAAYMAALGFAYANVASTNELLTEVLGYTVDRNNLRAAAKRNGGSMGLRRFGLAVLAVCAIVLSTGQTDAAGLRIDGSRTDPNIFNFTVYINGELVAYRAYSYLRDDPLLPTDIVAVKAVHRGGAPFNGFIAEATVVGEPSPFGSNAQNWRCWNVGAAGGFVPPGWYEPGFEETNPFFFPATELIQNNVDFFPAENPNYNTYPQDYFYIWRNIKAANAECLFGPTVPDEDQDGIPDDLDNCPTIANPDQIDANDNAYGDVCVSPNANIGNTADLGYGVIVGDGATIRNGAVVGDKVIIQDNATVSFFTTVGEESLIGAGSLVLPGADIGSHVILGENVIVGFGAQIGDGIIVGDNVIIPFGAVLEDYDSDSVSDYVEDDAPNNGDGNDDGIQDSQQGTVASLRNAVDNSYATLISSNGTLLTRVQALRDPSSGGLPPSVNFPYGFFKFVVNDVPSGGAATMEIILPGVVETYYKYGPTDDNPDDHWYEFLSSDPTQPGATIDGNVVTLHLIDGQRGDNDLKADGKISEPGGPGTTQLNVDIDVRPFRRHNIIRINEDDDDCEDYRRLRVAVFGTPDFDVADIDTSTLVLGDPTLDGTAAPIKSKKKRLNRDHRKDLLMVFSTCELYRNGALDLDTNRLDVSGETIDGIPFIGSDSVRVLNKRRSD